MASARKPWPKEMDEWSHPRHGADGNAVSCDTLVAPPERVRWIAAATRDLYRRQASRLGSKPPGSVGQMKVEYTLLPWP